MNKVAEVRAKENVQFHGHSRSNGQFCDQACQDFISLDDSIMYYGLGENIMPLGDGASDDEHLNLKGVIYNVCRRL